MNFLNFSSMLPGYSFSFLLFFNEKNNFFIVFWIQKKKHFLCIIFSFCCGVFNENLVISIEMFFLWKNIVKWQSIEHQMSVIFVNISNKFNAFYTPFFQHYYFIKNHSFFAAFLKSHFCNKLIIALTFYLLFFPISFMFSKKRIIIIHETRRLK